MNPYAALIGTVMVMSAITAVNANARGKWGNINDSDAFHRRSRIRAIYEDRREGPESSFRRHNLRPQPQNYLIRKRAPSNWQAAKQAARSPKQIAALVSRRIKFTRDQLPEHEWQTGQESWQRGYGDCEDFAVCVRELAQKAGFRSDIYVFSSKTRNEHHAVTIGTQGGRMWMSSNGSYVPIRSLEDAAFKLESDMSWQGDLISYKQVSTESKRDYWIKRVGRMTASATRPKNQWDEPRPESWVHPESWVPADR